MAFSLTPGGRSKSCSMDCNTDLFLSDFFLCFWLRKNGVRYCFLAVFIELFCFLAGSSLSTRLPRRRNSRRAAVSLMAAMSMVVLVPFLSSHVAM